MANWNILGRRIIFKIENQKKNEKQTEKKDENFHFVMRIFILLLIFIFFGLASKMLNNFETYQEEDIAIYDIIAPTSIQFENKQKSEELMNEIGMTTDKVFTEDKKTGKDIEEKVALYLTSVDEARKTNLKTAMIDIGLKPQYQEEIFGLSDKKFNESALLINSTVEEMLKNGIKEGANYKERVGKRYFNSSNELEKNIVLTIIKPNYFFDEEATKRKIKSRLKNLDRIVEEINSGDIVVKKGKNITKLDIEKLKALGIYESFSMKIAMATFLYLIIVSVIFGMVSKRYIKEEIIDNKLYYSTLIILIIMSIISLVLKNQLIFFYPFGAMILILGVLKNEKYATVMGSIFLLMVFAYNGYNEILLVANIVEMFVAIYYIKKIKNRTDIINAGIAMGVLKMLAVFSLGLIIKKDFVESVLTIGEVFISGILSGMLTIAILPYLENTFNILTEIKLIELGDFSHPLLKELVLKAPGTFHHSILVASLAESGAEAIGANATFARVACYYHDIGKIKRPNFFVENQFKGMNPHEKLNPYMSSLIITSHTKDGVEMAKKHRIPKEITDIMIEHQGTTLLAYFYNQVKKENPDVNEADFRYLGRKPKTRESGVIMLADSIEAAVRSMEDKNALAVESMIRKIINGKIEAGQLQEAELTFKDIELIIQSFVKVIQGIYHSRIKYPELEKLKNRGR